MSFKSYMSVIALVTMIIIIVALALFIPYQLVDEVWEAILIWLSGALLWFFGLYEFVEHETIEAERRLKELLKEGLKYSDAYKAQIDTLQFLKKSFIRGLIRFSGAVVGILMSTAILIIIVCDIFQNLRVISMVGCSILTYSIIALALLTTIGASCFAYNFFKNQPGRKYLTIKLERWERGFKLEKEKRLS